MIRVLHHSEIDKTCWDLLITKSPQFEMYALSWYLDIVSPNWGAIVYGDYDAVLPLPLKSKFGFTYIVQSPYCQKLGVFSTQLISIDVLQLFSTELRSFLSVRYSSNSNIFLNFSKHRSRENYVLSLNESYETIRTSYNSNCKRNIQKAEKNGVTVQTISKDEFWKFYSESCTLDIPDSYTNIIKPLMKKGEEQNSLYILGAFYNNTLCGATVFFVNAKKIYYLITWGNAESKEIGAMFAIIDSCIKKYAAIECVLDFEGSEIPGIAQFYKGFGAVCEPYWYGVNNRFSLLNFVVK